jgi:hypothetical protein
MPTVFPAQNAPANVPIYPYVYPSFADTIALGSHSLIFYNGLILNDRSRPDRYKVEDVDGLGGADIRDSRTPRPAAHGEIPYDSFFSGQTLTLSGKIEAGSLQQLTYMEAQLRAAFGNLVESPMKFNWWDVKDDFYDSQASAFWWKTLIGSSFTTNNGLLSINNAEETILYHGKRAYNDYRAIIEIRPQTSKAAGKAGLAVAMTASNSYIRAFLERNTITKKIEVKFQSVTPTGMTEGLGLGISEEKENFSDRYFLEVAQSGNKIRLALYVEDPSETLYPKFGGTATGHENTISGVTAERFGEGISGYVGIFCTNPEMQVGLVKIEGIYPGDFVVPVRSITTPMIKGAQQTSVDKFKQEFQVAVRASDPHLVGPVRLEQELQLQKIEAEYWSVAQTVMNKGNWESRPILVFRGSIAAGSQLLNLETGEYFEFNESVQIGESGGEQIQFIEVDCANFTIVDQLGNNRFSIFAPASNFITLIPGPNRLVFLNPALTGGTASCKVLWKHTWK